MSAVRSTTEAKTEIHYSHAPRLEKFFKKKETKIDNPHIKRITFKGKSEYIQSLNLLADGNILLFFTIDNMLMTFNVQENVEVHSTPVKGIHECNVIANEIIICNKYMRRPRVLNSKLEPVTFLESFWPHNQFIQINAEIMIEYSLFDLEIRREPKLYINSQEIEPRDPKVLSLHKALSAENRIWLLAKLGDDKFACVLHNDLSKARIIEVQDNHFVTIGLISIKFNSISAIKTINKEQFVIHAVDEDGFEYLYFYDFATLKNTRGLALLEGMKFSEIKVSLDGKTLFGFDEYTLYQFDISSKAIQSVTFPKRIDDFVILPDGQVIVLIGYSEIHKVEPQAFTYLASIKKLEKEKKAVRKLGTVDERKFFLRNSFFKYESPLVNRLISEYDHGSPRMILPHPISDATLPQLHFVLDIDHTLARMQEKTKFLEIADQLPPENYFTWFAERNLFIRAAGLNHVLYPGTLEFIQFILQIPNVRLSFFSAGIESRNKEFVEKLFALAFPENHNELIKDIAVFSRPDLEVNPEDKTSSIKNLKKVLTPGDSLKRVILIDDQKKVIAEDQQTNCLLLSNDTFRFSDVHQADERHGKKYFYLANHIFYLTGLLMHALEKDRHNFAQHVFDIQLSLNNLSYAPFHHPEFFITGLERLQKLNEHLQFYGSKKAPELHLGCAVVCEDEQVGYRPVFG